MVKKGRRKKYINLPMSFDIETTSYKDENGKHAFMYVWQFCLDGKVTFGRTWGEFCNYLDTLREQYDKEYYLCIYVHNLAFEFQFMRFWFEWEDVFAVKTRTPIYARTTNKIEFRDSYILSGFSLAKVGKHLKKPVEKLKGDLDYRLIRHSKTPLTDDELAYCRNDVLILDEYIRELLDTYGTIANIPLTQTGVVRRDVRNNCFSGEDKGRAYKYKLKQTRLQVDEYIMAHRAFLGGFTHANHNHVDNMCYDVSSFDFTSSYPAVMVSELFPMGKGMRIVNPSKKQLERYIKTHCVVMDIVLSDVKPVFDYDHYISVSRVLEHTNVISDNGRIVKADSIHLVCTELDYKIINKVYSYSNITVNKIYVYRKEYLPKEIVEKVIEYYKDKNTLKGVKGQEQEYMHKKQMLNSIYGMSVTNIVKDDKVYKNNEWQIIPVDLEKKIYEYNTDFNGRFLSYIWGIYVTAYARFNLWTGILELKNDYIYSDTDSLKLLNYQKHIDYFTNYNQRVKMKIDRCLSHYNIDIEDSRPSGKQLGIWDYEGTYKAFKTLGAKRYMYTDDDSELHITVAGLPKSAVEYFKKQVNPYIIFDNGLSVPKEYTHKLIHTYIDDEDIFNVTDYLGNKQEVISLSGVYLEETDFNLSMSDTFISYLATYETPLENTDNNFMGRN